MIIICSIHYKIYVQSLQIMNNAHIKIKGMQNDTDIELKMDNATEVHTDSELKPGTYMVTVWANKKKYHKKLFI